MKSERVEIEEVKVFYRLTCNWCGFESEEFDAFDDVPEGWIEHKVVFDVEAYFEKHSQSLELFGAAGVATHVATAGFGASSWYHFNSEEHLKLWKKNPPSNKSVNFVVMDDSNET